MTTKQQEKSQQTRNELMAAASELFGRQGYASTTVAQITGHAGYAKGSFYRHWPSKDKLFLDIVEQKLLEYRSARDDKLREARDLREAMHIIWDFLEDMVRDRNWAKVFLEFTVHGARSDNVRDDLGLSRYRLSEKVFADLIRPFMETDYPPEKLGALNTVLFEGFMVHNALETGVVDLKDIREAAVTLVMERALSGDVD